MVRNGGWTSMWVWYIIVITILWSTYPPWITIATWCSEVHQQCDHYAIHCYCWMKSIAMWRVITMRMIVEKEIIIMISSITIIIIDWTCFDWRFDVMARIHDWHLVVWLIGTTSMLDMIDWVGVGHWSCSMIDIVVVVGWYDGRNEVIELLGGMVVYTRLLSCCPILLDDPNDYCYHYHLLQLYMCSHCFYFHLHFHQ